MNPRDVTFVTTAIKPRPVYTCLLTDRPCGLVPVVLRRLLFVPPLPVFFWWSAVVKFPLEQSPSLGVCQYVRIFRPFVVIFGFVFGSVGLLSCVDARPGGPVANGLLLAVLAVAVAVWIALGRWLKRAEFVRILRCDKSRGTATVRFSSVNLAQKAREVLLLPEDLGPRITL